MTHNISSLREKQGGNIKKYLLKMKYISIINIV